MLPAAGRRLPTTVPGLLITGGQIEDAAWLSELIRIPVAELPRPETKSRR
jgi:hypothetical protein